MQQARDLIVEGLAPKHASRRELMRLHVLAMSCIVAMDTSITMWIESGKKGQLADLLADAAIYLRRGFRPSAKPL